MNKSQDFAFKVEGSSFPLSQLALRDVGENSSDTEFLVEAPDAMVVQFQPGFEKEGITGNLTIPLKVFIPAAEIIYKTFKTYKKHLQKHWHTM